MLETRKDYMQQRKRRERNSELGYYTNWEKGSPSGCVYCGKPANTREHVPSKSLLIEPFPENLPTIPACFECNNGFSADEEYFICCLEVLKNKVYANYSISEHVRSILSKKGSLHQLIESQISGKDSCIYPFFDTDRFARIITKLAIGHAGYEYDDLNFDGATGLWFEFAPNISEEYKTEFESPKLLDVIPEISSRFSCNACIIQNVESGEAFALSDWISVQDQRYSYNVSLNDSGGVSVKMIILNFLYCQVDFE